MKMLRSISLLVSGSILAQFIALLTSPLLTRLYSPEEIGVYTFVLSYISMFIPVINGRYDISIVMEKDEQNVFSLIKGSLFVGAFLSAVFTIAYGVYYIFSPTVGAYPYYTIIYVFFLLLGSSIVNVLTSYNNRLKEYKLLSSVSIIRSLFQNGGSVLFGVCKTGLTGLLLSYTVGQFMGLKKQSSSLKKSFNVVKKVSLLEVNKVLKRHYKQPLFSAPALFFNSFSYSSITFFIGSLYGMQTVGYYSITTRVLGLPLLIISGNIAKIFVKEASEEYNSSGKYSSTLTKLTLLLLLMAVPMVVFMYYFAPTITTFVFGANWSEAGEYIRILALMFGLRFIVTSLSGGLVIANKQFQEMILQFLFILTSTVVFIVAKFQNYSTVEFLTLINVGFSICFLIYYVFIFLNSISKPERKIKND